MRAISEWLDLIGLAAGLIVGCSFLILLLLECRYPMVQSNEDKTALSVKNALYSNNSVKTGADLLMSAIISGDNAPEPSRIQINNSPIMDLGNYSVVNPYSNAANLYNKNGNWKLGNMLDYKISEVNYKFDATNGDYWQYVLIP